MVSRPATSRRRPAPRHKAPLAVVALLAASGATCVPSDYGGAPFACAQAPTCPEGYYCGVDRVCHRGARPADLRRAEPWPWDAPRPDAHVPSPGDLRPELQSADTSSVILFQDDFTAGGGFVNDGTGNWLVANGVMTQKKCDAGPDAIVPSRSWTDVKVTVRMRGETVCPLPAPDNYSFAGLLIRAVSIGADCKNKRYYMCEVDFANTPNHSMAIVKLDGDATCAGKGVVAQPIGAVQLNSWYTVTFSAVGNVLTCTVSGPGLAETKVSFTDTTTPLASGSVGLLTESATVSFDDFVVVGQ